MDTPRKYPAPAPPLRPGIHAGGPLGRRDFLRSAGGLLACAALPRAWRPRLEAPVWGDPLDFVQVGREMLTRHGFEATATGTLVFYQVLERACARIPVGPLTLWIPKDAFGTADARGKAVPPATAVLQLAVPALMRSLAQTAAWCGAEIADALQEKGLLAFAKQIEIGKEFDLGALAAPLPLAALCAKPDDKRVREPLAALEALLALPALSPHAAEGAPIPLPLAVLPTRRHMVEFLCLAGVVEPTLAGAFHQPAITGWMHSYYGSADYQGRVQMLCLEEGHTGDGALETWDQASQDTDAELARHILSYDALVALLGAQSAVAPNWFTLGMAFEGVFARYGRIGARLGADSVGDVTPPRQAFVPGGQSQGGQFPPNLSALRGTLAPKELRRFLEERKQAAYALLEERDAKDEQRRAARADDEVVYFNFRDRAYSEENGFLHFGPYLGQDVSHLMQRDVPYDLSLIQRALFAQVAAELAAREKGAALARLMTALPGATVPFEDLLREHAGVVPGELERALFAELKKK